MLTTLAGLSEVVAIAAGEFHSLALKVDGTVVGWGYERLWPGDAARGPQQCGGDCRRVGSQPGAQV